MDTKNRIETREAMRAEYDRLQSQLRKNRRIVYIGSCLICLFTGFMVGYIIAYPDENRAIITVEEAEPAPEAKLEMIRL